MMPINQAPSSFTSRFNALRDRYRVQAAAALAVIGSLTFIAAEVFPKVHDIVQKHDVVAYVTFLMVLDVAVSLHLHRRPGAAHLAKNQDESLLTLVSAVSECGKDGIDLLEYAGATTLPLIRAIARSRIPMRMLVKHPETVSGLQRQRMITTLDTLYNSIFESYPGRFEIRCYRMPYTLRGRRLGNEILELGWLTADIRRQMAYGHGNPSMVVDLSAKGSDYLREFFERTFTDLWNAEDTEDARAVLERLQAPLN